MGAISLTREIAPFFVPENECGNSTSFSHPL